MEQNSFGLPEGSLRNLPPSSQKKKRSILYYWYLLTALPDASSSAPLKQQEAVRRSRLASIILLIAIILVLPAIPSAIGNITLTVTLVLVIAVDLVAFVLNRMGHTIVAGILTVCTMEGGLMASIIFASQGFGPSNMSMFDLLVQSECVAVSLLPAEYVFVVALFNCSFILARLLLIPGVTNDLQVLLQTDGSRIILTPMILQVIVALVSFLWVRSALQALVRADRAEVVADLERREIERQQRDIEQKNRLDLGIQQILETHVKVANGNLDARAPLTKENELWRIAYALNNLLQRLQRASIAEQEYNRARQETIRIAEEIQRAKKGQRAPRLKMTGTYLDSLIHEITRPADHTANHKSIQDSSFSERPPGRLRR